MVWNFTNDLVVVLLRTRWGVKESTLHCGCIISVGSFLLISWDRFGMGSLWESTCNFMLQMRLWNHRYAANLTMESSIAQVIVLFFFFFGNH